MSAGSRKRHRRPTPIKPTPRFKRCQDTGKRRYADRLTALEALAAASKVGVKRAYHCTSCGGFHLTSKTLRRIA